MGAERDEDVEGGDVWGQGVEEHLEDFANGAAARVVGDDGEEAFALVVAFLSELLDGGASLVVGEWGVLVLGFD